MLRPRLKQPGETRTLDVPLDLAVGRTIASVDSVTALARGLVAELDALVAADAGSSGATAFVQISGGTDGEVYLVTVEATDDLGDVVQTEAEIHVADLAFATPDAPSSSSTYIDPAAYVARFGLEEAVRLTDEVGTGRIDKTVLYTALADAAAEIDTYLARRYVVPVDPVPAVLVAIAADLARERLHVAGPSEAVTQRATAARRQLKDLASGTAVLAGGVAKPTGGDTPLVDAPDRLFTRDSMAGL